MKMASERQIAANRRNARKSSGPRSSAGKERASRNAYRHGLSARVAPSAEFAKRIEKLARKIAGDTTDEVILEYAHTAAQAQFDLAGVRQVRVALMQRMAVFGEFESGETATATRPVPSPESERTAEAVRRALPELLKLDRYAQRALGRRERSVRIISDRISSINK
jgi:hypothetical protein